MKLLQCKLWADLATELSQPKQSKVGPEASCWSPDRVTELLDGINRELGFGNHMQSVTLCFTVSKHWWLKTQKRATIGKAWERCRDAWFPSASHSLYPDTAHAQPNRRHRLYVTQPQWKEVSEASRWRLIGSFITAVVSIKCKLDTPVCSIQAPPSKINGLNVQLTYI